MLDAPADVPLVPAKWQWEEDGRIEEHVFTDDDGEVIMVPEYDPLMDDFVERHTHGRPDTDSIDYIKSYGVSQETWERVDVVTQIKAELSEATGEQFAESEHYKEGALQCYNAHGNPDNKNRCADVFTDEKRIGRSRGIAKKHQMYVCHMCPYVQTYIMQEVRNKAKLYDPEAVKVTMSKIAQQKRRRNQRR